MVGAPTLTPGPCASCQTGRHEERVGAAQQHGVLSCTGSGRASSSLACSSLLGTACWRGTLSRHQAAAGRGRQTASPELTRNFGWSDWLSDGFGGG